MEPEVKISARLDPNNPGTCRFQLDRLLHEGSVYFADRKKAEDSPLAERLFQIEDVTAVRIWGDSVTVTRLGWEDWRPFVQRITEALRDHLKSGQPAVSPNLKIPVLSDVEMKNKVQEVLDTQINPAVAGHGGFIELLDVKDNRVYLRMGGGCQGCGMANVTLRQGIEASLRELLPQIAEILDETDHASGTNPYYTPSQK